MRKRIQKKSEVLREGYVKGLRQAQRIINEMLGDEEEMLDNEGGQRGLDSKLRMICNMEGDRVADVKELLSMGANPNCVDSYNATPLVKAAVNGNIKICRLLLKKGANPRGAEGGENPCRAVRMSERLTPTQKCKICDLLGSIYY